MLFLYTATVLLFFTAAGAFRRRIEWMLPITVMGYTLILFIAAFFDRLKLGWNFLCASGAVLWSVAVARLCQSREFRKNFRENFLTPGFLLMIASIPVLLSMTRTLTLVPLSDEFTHWGGAARELYFTDALPVFNKLTTVRFTDFPPATSLLQYMFFSSSTETIPKASPISRRAFWRQRCCCRLWEPEAGGVFTGSSCTGAA